MNNWLRYSLLFGGIFIAVKGLTKATQLRNITDKYKIGIGFPQVHRAGITGSIIDIKNTTITNQSNIAVTVRNLYVSIKYTDAAGQLQDLLIQSDPVAPFGVAAYAQTVLPTIRLNLPTSNIGVIARIVAGTLSPKLNVITRAQIGGVEVEMSNEVNSAQYLQPIRNILAI